MKINGKEVKFELFDYDHEVQIVVSDDDVEWYVCTITDKGKMYLEPHIGPEVNLQLDEHGRIMLTESLA